MEFENTGFLIAYDVCCPRRLVRVHRFLSERAVAVQYSVFAASGDSRWASTLAGGLDQIIDPRADDARIYTTPKRASSLVIDAVRSATEVTIVAADFPELLRKFFRSEQAKRNPDLI